jgi:hypothetical protein
MAACSPGWFASKLTSRWRRLLVTLRMDATAHQSCAHTRRSRAPSHDASLVFRLQYPRRQIVGCEHDNMPAGLARPSASTVNLPFSTTSLRPADTRRNSACHLENSVRSRKNPGSSELKIAMSLVESSRTPARRRDDHGIRRSVERMVVHALFHILLSHRSGGERLLSHESPNVPRTKSDRRRPWTTDRTATRSISCSSWHFSSVLRW